VSRGATKPMRLPFLIALVVFLLCLSLALFSVYAGFSVTGLPVLLVGAGLAIGIGINLYEANQTMYRELVKQIAIWLGIVALLPLSVWFGTSAFSPPPDDKEHSKAQAKIEEQIKDLESRMKEEPQNRERLRAEREKLRKERDDRRDEFEAAEKVFYGRMFWVAYPIGLVAIIIGTFFPVQAVGAGLQFGGLASLTAGCYSYWDRMDAWLRFGSLVVALVVLLALGTWRFWPASTEPRSTDIRRD